MKGYFHERENTLSLTGREHFLFPALTEARTGMEDSRRKMRFMSQQTDIWIYAAFFLHIIYGELFSIIRKNQ